MDKKALGTLTAKDSFIAAKAGPAQAFLYFSDKEFERHGYFTAKVPDGDGMKEVRYTEWTSQPSDKKGDLVWSGASTGIKDAKPFLNRGATADLSF